eukprot:scaffold2482_cov407-Prasinococcus_capsulatus_cf.AAC.6
MLNAPRVSPALARDTNERCRRRHTTAGAGTSGPGAPPRGQWAACLAHADTHKRVLPARTTCAIWHAVRLSRPHMNAELRARPVCASAHAQLRSESP